MAKILDLNSGTILPILNNPDIKITRIELFTSLTEIIYLFVFWKNKKFSQINHEIYIINSRVTKDIFTDNKVIFIIKMLFDNVNLNHSILFEWQDNFIRTKCGTIVNKKLQFYENL